MGGVVRLLLANGATADITRKNGVTALIRAAQNGHENGSKRVTRERGRGRSRE
jgi:ankyrin repeat protein